MRKADLPNDDDAAGRRIDEPVAATTPSSQGFPLGALFLFVALFAVMVAQLKAVSSTVPPGTGGMAAMAGGTCGLICGALIGLYHFRRLRGLSLGILTGVVFGALMGPICAAAFQYPKSTILFTSSASLGLVLFSMLYRFANYRDPVSK